MDSHTEETSLAINDEFLFYSVIYSSITVIFGLAVLSKFLTNEFRFGLRAALSLAILFIGEPVCHFLLKGPAGIFLFAVCCLMIYSVLPASHLPAAGKSVLITGCDSGFGHALAKKLDSIGMNVFAGCLDAQGPGAINLKQSSSDRLEIVQLDVTKQNEIDDVYNVISIKTSGLWGLVNNAGTCCLADIEMTSTKIAESIMNVNFYGTLRMCQTFLPLIRKEKGRIVNMSSFVGRVGLSHFGVYAASKHAVEGLSDVLRLEMRKFGVHVSIVECGAFKTNCMDVYGKKSTTWNECPPVAREHYGQKYFDMIYEMYKKSMDQAPTDVMPVVRAYRSALLSKRPRERYPCGHLIETVLTVFPVLPTWISDKICDEMSFGRGCLPSCLE